MIRECADLARSLAAHHVGGHRLHRDRHRAHELFQASTISALAAGLYDGGPTYGELMRHGDFGLGTFEHLDGEMVALDGRFLHLHADGSVDPVRPNDRAPFAAVTYFSGDLRRALQGPVDIAGLHDAIRQLVGSDNLYCAVRVDGQFRQVVTRTARRQEPPYGPLDAATADQAVTTFRDVRGTCAGFEAPDYGQGIAVPGLHLHFVTEDRHQGGHVLDFELQDGQLLVDEEAELHLAFPQDPAFLAASLGGPETAAVIRVAEGMRDPEAPTAAH